MPKPNFLHLSAILFFTAFLLAACNNKDAGGAGMTNADTFVHFKISGEEEAESVTCLLQFFADEKAAKGILLAPAASVMLDGEAIAADSARLTGTYYEVQKPLQNFAGNHTITYKDGEGKVQEERFAFAPFGLATEPTERVKRETLQLQLTGLQPKDSLQVILVDTSFSTMDIDRLQLAENGNLQLTKRDLKILAAGPVTLYLIKETEHPVKNGNGKITVSYSLKREFELVD